MLDIAYDNISKFQKKNYFFEFFSFSTTWNAVQSGGRQNLSNGVKQGRLLIRCDLKRARWYLFCIYFVVGARGDVACYGVTT